MNLTDPISLHARTRGDSLAVVQGDATVTYRDFNSQINAIASQLLNAGAALGEPIGVCLSDRPIHLATICAALRIGAILLPMDWRWTMTEQSKIAREFSPRFVVVDGSRPHPSDLETVVVDERIAPRRDDVAAIDCTDRPAVLGLSSGTTGDPKAVVTTHAQYRDRMGGFVRACHFQDSDRYGSTLPLVFSAGRMFALANLAIGATVVLFPSLSSPADIAAGIVQHRVTTTCLVPTVSRAMLTLPVDRQPRFPNLRVLVSIGAPLSAPDRAAVRTSLSPNLVDVYASTGGSLATAIWPDEQDRFPDSVGRAAERVQLEIVDDHDQPLPVATIGRVRYRGPGMPIGFYKPVAKGDEDLRDGWFYPGDYGSLNDEGFLFLSGRRSEIVIRGGINVFTPEVERAILSHPSVIETAVVGVPSPAFGEELVAFIRSAEPIVHQDMVQHCRQLLAAYKIPSRFHRVDTLPKNSSGKVLKRNLIEPA